MKISIVKLMQKKTKKKLITKHTRKKQYKMNILTSIMFFSEKISGTSPLQSKITVPVSSKPRRPALPAICINSEGWRSLKFNPSCLRIESNTTVLAGILTPMAKVSVAKRTCNSNKK